MTDDYWKLLSRSVPEPERIEIIASGVGVGREEIFWRRAGMDVWKDVLDLLCKADGIERLHARVCEELPTTARDKLDKARPYACRNPPPSAGRVWYTSPDVYDARFVGEAAQRPMINRGALRSSLQAFVAGYPVLLVFGEPGSGRSYSWYLIEHVASRENPPITVHLVDIKEEWGLRDCEPQALMRVIADLLGIDEAFDVKGTSDTKPRLLATRLRRHLIHRKQVDCVVIDGVDRSNVLAETRATVRQLIERVAKNQMGKLRLIVTGRRDATEVWDAATSQGILWEDIATIDATELQQFFMLTANHLGRPVDEQAARSLVAQLDTGPWTGVQLEALGAKVAQLAKVLLL